MKVFRFFVLVALTSAATLPEQVNAALHTGLGAIFKRTEGWNNNYDGVLNFECPDGQSISTIDSQHDNGYEDRQFRLTCRVGPVSNNCRWSTFVNSYDEPVHYNCGDQAVITGWYSEHNNYYEDRISKFKCCKLTYGALSLCHMSGYVNWYDMYFSFTVPSDRVLYGVSSVHHNYYEDRRFQFETCTRI